MPISYLGNTIRVTGEFSHTDCFRMLAVMHNLVSLKGYQDIALDFTQCTKAFSHEMVAICVKSQQYWKDGIDVDLTLPADLTLVRLFQNTNWAHLIDAQQFEPSRFRGYTHAPAIRFSDAKEQYEAVNKVLDILLAAIQHFRREDLRAIEWVINEVTDNVINHSESHVGGIIQVTNHRQRSQIEFVVADAGLGIPATLKPSRPDLLTDHEALDAAIREGVTRDKSFGQGNGLYGTWQVSKKSLGSFQLTSGYASLKSTERDGVHTSRREIPFPGTLVSCRIGYSETIELQDALVFAGNVFTPADFIESHYEIDEAGTAVFDLAKESYGFGSRAAGDPVRRKILNIIRLIDGGRLVVDLAGVALVSSSYADEVFGKLFLELGPLEFGRNIEIRHVDPLVRALIDKAILQRMRQ